MFSTASNSAHQLRAEFGIAFGAGLYEHRVVVTQWVTSSPEAGIHWNPGVARQDDTVHPSYFIPAMVTLMASEDSAQSAAAAMRWSNLNYIRHAIVLAAWIAALKAFATFYEQRGSA